MADVGAGKSVSSTRTATDLTPLATSADRVVLAMLRAAAALNAGSPPPTSQTTLRAEFVLTWVENRSVCGRLLRATNAVLSFMFDAGRSASVGLRW